VSQRVPTRWMESPLEGSEPTGLSKDAARPLWRRISVCTDAFTIVASVADIATDLLVLREFRELGYSTFFAVSATIFVLAQMSYAFLFTASYAIHRSSWPRVVVFLMVLPLAQLVPLFTWVEAMHLPALDSVLRRLGLRPTSYGKTAMEMNANESLWGLMQSKYESHAGFLVEAFVEAIPQAVLQTVFAVVARRGTALNACSIFISLLTMASKGYLLSYALDGVTFVFNFVCIVADCVGLFASATLLAVHGLHATFPRVLAALSITGLVLSIVAGHALLWFTIMDDHLKLRDAKRWPYGVRYVSNIFFDLYVVRVGAWLVAIVPCIVVFAGARLSLLPVCGLKSMDPNLVRHARFFRALTHFLNGQGGGSSERDTRLLRVNNFIVQAHRSAARLPRILTAVPCWERADAIRRWAINVGTLSPSTASHMPSLRDRTRASEEENRAVQQAILDSLAVKVHNHRASGAAAMLRARIWRLSAVAWMQRQYHQMCHELRGRSEIFATGCDRTALQTEFRMRPFSILLRAFAFVALMVILLCGPPLALCHAALMLTGVAYPSLHVVWTCGVGLRLADAALDVALPAVQLPLTCGTVPAVVDAATMLPCALAIAYTIALVVVAVLTPFVARRQVVWLEIAGLHGLPDDFYGGAVIAEIRKRHLRDSMLRQRLGYNLAQSVLHFLEQ